MRTILLGVAVVAVGCHSKASEPGTASSASGTASASGSGTGSASASGAAPKDAHPMPPAMVEKLKAYGAPHGTPIYVPPNGKEPEHWLAFVGGEAAMSAWLVTPSDSAHLIGQIGDWPTALKIDGAHIEIGPHGFPGNDGSTFVWLLATSLPGMGQPAGLHGVVRIGIDGAQFSNSVSTMEDTLVPLAGVTSADDIGKKIEPVSAEMNRTMNLLSDDAQTQLGATLGDPKTTDDALAALIPKDGFGVATAWQGIFVKPTGHGKTPAELRALLQGKAFTCNYITCDGPAAQLVLGEQGGKVVIRDVLVPPAQPIGAGTRKVVPPSATTAVTERTLRETGVLDAKVLAEAPLGDRGGTIGVANNSNNLIARDGDYVTVGSVSTGDDTTAAMLRFVDVDGDGRTDVAVATTASDQGTTMYTFATLAPGGHDLPAGMAALGAKDLDDAVARALALDAHPVTAAQACALLTSIKNKSSLAKAGPHARVLAFEEPGEPEAGGVDMGKEGPHAIKDAFSSGCDLDCDATRPECERPAMGPDTDYFLFTWNGDKLELALAMIYMGA